MFSSPEEIACLDTACIISASSILNMTSSQYGLLNIVICKKCSTPALDKDLELLKDIKKRGNFKNFKKISLKKDVGDGLFLEGALKIQKSSRSKFKVRGRICRSSDFDKIVFHLKEVEKMVQLTI